VRHVRRLDTGHEQEPQARCGIQQRTPDEERSVPITAGEAAGERWPPESP